MLHDSTERKYTYRISQNNKEFVKKLASMIRGIGFKSWIYEEGNREIYVVEFSKKVFNGCKVETRKEKRDYIRGYFDSEGSVPKSPEVRFYIYFAQQDKEDLEELKGMLNKLGIQTGRLHRPSKKEDPEYWRFYISTKSHEKFAREIGSWHPTKDQLLREMIQSTP